MIQLKKLRSLKKQKHTQHSRAKHTRPYNYKVYTKNIGITLEGPVKCGCLKKRVFEAKPNLCFIEFSFKPHFSTRGVSRKRFANKKMFPDCCINKRAISGKFIYTHTFES